MLRTVFADSGRGFFVPPMMPAAFEQPVPFPAEVKRRDVREGHRRQRGIEVGRQLSVPFQRLGRQLLFRVLAEKL